jgi:UDP-arabinose 4-epimerase
MVANILVSGGAGYIGSHACKALAQAEYLPITLDNLVYGHRRAVQWGPFIEGDLADGTLLRRVIRHYKIKAVIHFAAYAYVGESMQDPGKYFRNNVANTINLLDAMVETGVGYIVFSSTCATYGVPQRTPVGEYHPQQPVNPYGESKLFIERALRWYDVAHAIRSVSLRYFNAAGADPDGEIGEDHDPETHLIPLVIRAALDPTQNVKIFGTDYATPDGTAVRDYIHVTDLARAHVKAMDQLLDGCETISLNLGTGTGHSVREVIDAVQRVSGRKVDMIEAPRRTGDPPMLVAQPGLATDLLGWVPQYSDLDTIVTTALRWHERQFAEIDAVTQDTLTARVLRSSQEGRLPPCRP